MTRPVHSTLLFALVLALVGCGKEPLSDDPYIRSIQQERREKDDYMKNDPNSPFNADPHAAWAPLEYYPVDSNFVFESALAEYDRKDTLTFFGTEGDLRRAVRYGYLSFAFEGKERRVNVYQGETTGGEKYYAVWFTDETTGEETYDVGRYLDIEYLSDAEAAYVLDFNKAYNPYCAYSSMYSCVIPPKENRLSVAITAGEKKFHP
ncbi:MAG: DUF1684 domain-containing protein [Ignavibacteriales bacterium]|nr:DUF1684 domain-containing protein [Ignavibacteriales bacterium]